MKFTDRVRAFFAPGETTVTEEFAAGPTARHRGRDMVLGNDMLASMTSVKAGGIYFLPTDEIIKRKGWAIYKEMLNDDQVKSCLAFKKILIAGRTWEIAPADDSPRRNAGRVPRRGVQAHRLEECFNDALTALGVRLLASARRCSSATPGKRTASSTCSSRSSPSATRSKFTSSRRARQRDGRAAVQHQRGRQSEHHRHWPRENVAVHAQQAVRQQLRRERSARRLSPVVGQEVHHPVLERVPRTHGLAHDHDEVSAGRFRRVEGTRSRRSCATCRARPKS
jgi:hypothetical protein